MITNLSPSFQVYSSRFPHQNTQLGLETLHKIGEDEAATPLNPKQKGEARNVVCTKVLYKRVEEFQKRRGEKHLEKSGKELGLTSQNNLYYLQKLVDYINYN